MKLVIIRYQRSGSSHTVLQSIAVSVQREIMRQAHF